MSVSELPDDRRNYLQGGGNARVIASMVSNAHHFVPITGVVRLPTSFGVFLDVNERRIFLRYSDTSASRRRFVGGEPSRSMCVVASRKRRDSSPVDRERDAERAIGGRRRAQACANSSRRRANSDDSLTDPLQNTR